MKSGSDLLIPLRFSDSYNFPIKRSKVFVLYAIFPSTYLKHHLFTLAVPFLNYGLLFGHRYRNELHSILELFYTFVEKTTSICTVGELLVAKKTRLYFSDGMRLAAA